MTAPLPPDTPPDIQVTVQVRHLPEHSQPGRQLFAYFITLENRSGDTWQLLARHWDIWDGRGQGYAVDGEGVVGEQPILAPGAQYTYNSFVTVEVLPGMMKGHYVMQDAWGTRAQVPIPPFRLDVAEERTLN